jgi:activating signal cointegrator complex subunit 3
VLTAFCLFFIVKLFELLGPEGLDLIEKLLQNRITIVDRFLNSSNDHKFQVLQGKKVCISNSNLEERFIGEQVFLI